MANVPILLDEAFLIFVKFIHKNFWACQSGALKSQKSFGCNLAELHLPVDFLAVQVAFRVRPTTLMIGCLGGEQLLPPMRDGL